jgi:hypothetical protein
MRHKHFHEHSTEYYLAKIRLVNNRKPEIFGAKPVAPYQYR